MSSTYYPHQEIGSDVGKHPVIHGIHGPYDDDEYYPRMTQPPCSGLGTMWSE
jgi:hypothetical protein